MGIQLSNRESWLHCKKHTEQFTGQQCKYNDNGVLALGVILDVTNAGTILVYGADHNMHTEEGVVVW